MKKLHDGYVVQGSGFTTIQATTRPDHLWPEIWSGMSKKQPNGRKSMNGLPKNQNSTLRESREESTPVIRMMRSSQKPWKNARKRLAGYLRVLQSLPTPSSSSRQFTGGCAPGQPPLSALQLANRRKSARFLTDLVDVFALPPHACGFTLQRLDLLHTWSDGVTTKSTLATSLLW